MINYRPAKQEDFEQVQVIENECFKEPYSYEELRYEFDLNPLNKIIVAESEGKVIGFIDFLITFNSATIMQVAVTKDYRRKGVATQLLSEMEKVFPKDIENMIETITLEVRISNTTALSLYLKNGYMIVVTKAHYYKDGENALYLVKRLI